MRLLASAIVSIGWCAVGFIMTFRPKLYRNWGRTLVDRTTYAENDRAMAATAVEFSNARDTVYGGRSVLIHRFRVVNAITGVTSPLHSKSRWAFWSAIPDNLSSH